MDTSGNKKGGPLATKTIVGSDSSETMRLVFFESQEGTQGSVGLVASAGSFYFQFRMTPDQARDLGQHILDMVNEADALCVIQASS